MAYLQTNTLNLLQNNIKHTSQNQDKSLLHTQWNMERRKSESVRKNIEKLNPACYWWEYRMM